MDRFLENIDSQIKFNQGKNIFHDNLEMFQFVKETVKIVSEIDELNPGSELFLIDYATDKAIEEFCKVNQYYSFDSESKNKLRQIYADLFHRFQDKHISVEEISRNHYQKLKKWLKESNSFAEKIYTNKNQIVRPVACFEYSSEIQTEILQIDINNLMGPVLDIGCGKQGSLVHHLKNHGINAYGIDRLKFTTPCLITADWLEYDYGTKKWGTIISNLGFSNHFIHHNLRADGNYIEYAKTYMNILYSLKVGGSFHYAPVLPFIEAYLNENQFLIEYHEIEKYDFKMTIVKRLK